MRRYYVELERCFDLTRVRIPVLIATLRDEILLELAEEFQVEEVVGSQRLFTHHGLHRLHVLADGVAGVQLIRHIRVVFPVLKNRHF